MTYHRGSSALNGLGAFPPAIGGEMDIDPRSHGTAIEGGRLVPTVWAQRALNAAGIRTVVDGLAGSATLNGLRSYWTRNGSRGPEPALQTGHPSWVFMSSAMEANLSLLRRVADPSGSTVAANSWTTPETQPRRTTSSSTSTSGGGSGGKPSSGASVDAPLAPAPGGGTDYTPWIVGGAITLAGLLAVGVFASRRRKPTKNGKRKSRTPRWRDLSTETKTASGMFGVGRDGPYFVGPGGVGYVNTPAALDEYRKRHGREFRRTR